MYLEKASKYMKPLYYLQFPKLHLNTSAAIPIHHWRQGRLPKVTKPALLEPSFADALVAIEQASTLGWDRYVGEAGKVIGMKTFGASAPLKELQKQFGFEPDKVVAVAKQLVGK